jgi:hypothetical protein
MTPQKRSSGELILAKQMSLVKFPAYEEEFKFLEDRKFRFDFAWPDKKVAVEVEGGVYSNSRHTSGFGFTKDCEKYNLAAASGWSVYRFTTEMVKNGKAVDFLSYNVFKLNACLYFTDVG